MGVAGFVGYAELGYGLGFAFGEEDRVIAEALRARHSGGDVPFPHAGEKLIGMRPLVGQHYRHEVGLAMSHSRHSLEEASRPAIPR